MSNLSKALKAAKYGPEAKKLEIKGHHFNVKKYVRPFGIKTLVLGKISHCLAGRPDDQITYQIHLGNNGALKFVKVKINDGGLTNIAAPVISVLGQYYTGVPIPSDLVESVGRKMGAAIDGTKWRSVVHYLIGEIAIRV